MNSLDLKRLGYLAGIGFGIIIVTAFAFSQIVFPIVLGRTPKVETPDVTGMSLMQAKRTMEMEKLHAVVKDSVFSESAKIETVMEQSPVPGEKIRQDGTVYLVISKGASTVVIPSLVGKTFQEAIITLRSAELKYTVIDSTYSDSYPANTVIRSIPFTGNKVEKRSTVKLILSRGAEAAPDTLESSLPVYPY